MKNIILVLLFTAALVGCKKNSQPEIEGYRITGEAPRVHNGIRVYLKTLGPNGRPVAKDTAIVMNEKFKFQGDLNRVEMVNMTVNSINGSLPLLLENNEIKITLNKENLSESEISGGASNNAMTEYKKVISDITTESNQLRKSFRNASEDMKKELSDKLVELNKQRNNYPFEFLNKNPDNYYSLMLVENLAKTRGNDIEKIASAFDGLSDDLKTTAYGKTVLDKIKATLAERAALSATEIGKKAPNFRAPNPDGKTLALNEVMGKVTIVDFWAAWCGPCRRENPNVVKIYEKYHHKGLEIIGVSLDGNRRQKNPKAAWTKAIADDNLNWHQVSNLKYFNEPIAKTYNIRSIPATFILDENGIIVAKNLRGNDLEKKVAELLN